MEELPLQNYADLEVPGAPCPLVTPLATLSSVPPPEPWLAFFSALPSDAKVDTFSRMWEAASPQEKGLIVEDLRCGHAPPQAPPLGQQVGC